MRYAEGRYGARSNGIAQVNLQLMRAWAPLRAAIAVLAAVAVVGCKERPD